MHWLKKADEIANEYHNSDSNISRARLKAEWYKEVERTAARLQNLATSNKKLTERRRKRAAGG